MILVITTIAHVLHSLVDLIIMTEKLCIMIFRMKILRLNTSTCKNAQSFYHPNPILPRLLPILLRTTYPKHDHGAGNTAKRPFSI